MTRQPQATTPIAAGQRASSEHYRFLLGLASDLTAAEDSIATLTGLSAFAVVGRGRQAGTYTLTSSTDPQKLFSWSANGALTLPVGYYEFRSQILLRDMSATSGNAQLLFGGTAVLASPFYHAWGQDAATATDAGAISGSGLFAGVSPAVDVVTPGVGTELLVSWQGSFQVTGAGTLIPQIALTTAAAATVRVGSWFTVERVANVNPQGAWS